MSKIKYAILLAVLLMGVSVAYAAGNGAKAYEDGFGSFGSGSYNALTFSKENYDTNGFHTTGGNNSRFTIPGGTSGHCLVGGTFTFSTNSTGVRAIAVRKSGSNYLGYVLVPAASGFGNALTINVMDACTAGSYYEIMVYQNSGSSLNNSGNFYGWVEVH